jgi:peptide-methionine (R)-S-oxide reductase
MGGGKVDKSEAEWREQLTPEQYHVTRERGTERPFTGVYTDTETAGTYRCVCCQAELFSSDDKYHSGCGWPSFSDVVDRARVELTEDRSHGMRRTEVTCAACGAHLGHVFPDGPTPTGERFCINSAALQLDAAE